MSLNVAERRLKLLLMAFWLFKSEPHKFSLDDLENSPSKTTTWDGIRNYRARNYLRDTVKLGDRVLFYHSSCEVPGVVGVAEVVKESYPDYTSWDPKSDYYDPKSGPENPRWFMVDVQFRERFPKMVTRQDMMAQASLDGMMVVQKCQRLSIQPVEAKHFEEVRRLGGL